MFIKHCELYCKVITVTDKVAPIWEKRNWRKNTRIIKKLKKKYKSNSKISPKNSNLALFKPKKSTISVKTL